MSDPFTAKQCRNGLKSFIPDIEDREAQVKFVVHLHPCLQKFLVLQAYFGLTFGIGLFEPDDNFDRMGELIDDFVGDQVMLDLETCE
jgi:hypothetical protein